MRPLSDCILRGTLALSRVFFSEEDPPFPSKPGDEAGESKNRRRRKTRKDGSRGSFQHSQAEGFAGFKETRAREFRDS